MQMSNEEFTNERIYQLVMIQVNKLKDEGIVSDKQYVEIDTKMRAKYKPKFGILCGINQWIYHDLYANMCHGKEA